MTAAIVPVPDELERPLRRSPLVSALLERWQAIDLPDCWLVAGAVVQTYWNGAHGYLPLKGISDIDIAYFDHDLSEASESAHIDRITRAFDDLSVTFDIKNEARVHLWYENHFGYAIAPYRSVEAAIDTFPTTAGAIGIRPVGGSLECYAPFGLSDLLELVVRPNKRQITQRIYEEKVARWQPVWPKLRIVDWNDA